MRQKTPTKYEGRIFLVSHYHGLLDLRKYSETAGEWETLASGPAAAFETQEQAEAYIAEQVAKLHGPHPDSSKWHQADIVQGGRHFGRSMRRGVKLTRRGERHEWEWSTVEYTPAPAQSSEPVAGLLAAVG